MKVGEEFRLQTTEGAEWDRAYREKAGALRQREADIAINRDQLLGAAAQQAIGEVRLLHGECNERRTFHLHTGNDEPNAGGDQIVAWLRDGWSIALKEVESEARKCGQDDPILHVFLPRTAADDLTIRIVEVQATRQVLDIKGIPSTNEGREARESMQSRYVAAQHLLDELIREITAAARVFQGGGAEVFGDSLIKKLDTAAIAALARLFPDFDDGDHKAWGVALNRAREGSDEPLKIVGWDKATEDHPVVRRVLAEVGNGAKGGQVRKVLQSSPCGWPRDAIDAALIALHRQGSIRVQLNGQPVAPGHLDQNKISTAKLYPESVRLGAGDKLALRSLFQKAGVSVKSGEEEVKAGEFLAALRFLADDAGGDAPLPACPTTTTIDPLDRVHGSEQLSMILAAKDGLEAAITTWSKIGKRKAKRLPGWNQLIQLAGHTATLPVQTEIAPEIEAIKTDRTLLDDTDHVAPLLNKAANALRSALTEQADAFQAAYDQGLKTLNADASWQQLEEADQLAILGKVRLSPPTSLAIKTDEDVLVELDRSSIDARVSAVAAVSDRVARALEEAARSLKPTAKRVSLRAATLEDEAAVKAWLAEHETKLIEAVAMGPVIVG